MNDTCENIGQINAGQAGVGCCVIDLLSSLVNSDDDDGDECIFTSNERNYGNSGCFYNCENDFILNKKQSIFLIQFGF